MPGCGMRQRQEQRLGLRQEQRLEQKLVQRGFILDTETGYHEQMEVLEKVKEDIGNNVYSDVNDFNYRVMKRIKKKKRTKHVKRVVQSLRDLIDNSEKSSKEISLDNIHQIANLGIGVNELYDYSDNTIKNVGNLYLKVPTSLEEVIFFGQNITNSGVSPNSLIDCVSSIAKKSNSEISVEEGFEKTRELVDNYSNNRKLLNNLMIGVLRRKRQYDRLRIDTMFNTIKEICDLYVPNNLEYESLSISEFITNKDLNSFLDKYSKIPLSIFSELTLKKPDEMILPKMNEIAGTKKMRDSKDNKRSFLNSFVTIRTKSRQGLNVIEDILLKSDGMKQSRDILAKYSSLCKMGMQKYDFNLDNGEQILNYIQNTSEFVNPVFNELSKEDIMKIRDLSPAHKYTFAYRPLLNLGTIYDKSYPKGVKLVSNIVSSLLNDKFEELRYGGEDSDKQLKALGNNVDEWKKNSKTNRVIGDIKGLEPKYNAIKNITQSLIDSFEQTQNEKITREYLANLYEKRTSLIGNLTDTKVLLGDGSKKIKEELNKIDSLYKQAEVLDKLHELKIEDFPDLPEIISGCLDRYSEKEFRRNIESINSIVNKKGNTNIRRVTIRDTDNPYELVNVGCTPIKSCQRWTEKTGYNDCLLAYIMDANKRLLQVVDDRSKIRVRSIYRLLDTDNLEDPVIFIEKPYADIESLDLYKVIVGSIMGKAYKMSEEVGDNIVVGANYDSYKSLIKDFAKKMDISYKTKNITSSFISKNKCEYSDGFGGRVNTGQKRSAKIGYVNINAEDNY